MANARNTLLFLSYGDGPHVDELLFSLLTLRRFPASALRGIGIRVVTDRADLYRSHGFEALPVPASTFEEWKGPMGFIHRCKVLAMKHVLERLGGKCILVDGDTYFRRPPAGLFERIGPGRSLLHRIEGRLADSRHDFNHRLGQILLDRSPGYHPSIDLARGPATVQWNAGVVGLDRRDIGLLDEVLGFVDYLRARTFAPVLEQLAFSVALQGRTRLRPARDVVFHYCTSPARETFRSALPGLLAASAGPDPAARARWLYDRRLRPSPHLAGKNRLKDLLNGAGIYPARDRGDCC